MVPRRPGAQGLTLGIALLALVGCDQSGDQALRGRLDALDARLNQIDRRLGEMEKSAPAADRLQEALGDLERRLGSVEARVGALAAAPAPGAPRAGVPSPPAVGPGAMTGPEADAARARAQALSALANEYRDKLQQLTAARAAGAPPSELSAQRRDLSQWFRDRRREILAGSAPTTAGGAPAAGGGAGTAAGAAR